ncbi:hypothetical protein LRO89_09085 [Priestia megaterium]|uniref:hypothetical protein n=1 Tax=Priestia megaterium TaxID=1404 RepID=UPI0039C18F2D
MKSTLSQKKLEDKQQILPAITAAALKQLLTKGGKLAAAKVWKNYSSKTKVKQSVNF